MRDQVDWIHLAQNSLMAGSCRYLNEDSPSVNGRKYHD
jgi:hypothetical protein